VSGAFDCSKTENYEVNKMRLVITVGWNKPTFKPSERELEACPDTFRCFNCDEKFPRLKLGGIVNHEFLCEYCRPYLDTWTVGCFRKFDERNLPRFGGVKVPDKVERNKAKYKEELIKTVILKDGTEQPVYEPVMKWESELKVQSEFVHWLWDYSAGFPGRKLKEAKLPLPNWTSDKPWGQEVSREIQETRRVLRLFESLTPWEK
jgi:hypothetical protein